MRKWRLGERGGGVCVLSKGKEEPKQVYHSSSTMQAAFRRLEWDGMGWAAACKSDRHALGCSQPLGLGGS